MAKAMSLDQVEGGEEYLCDCVVAVFGFIVGEIPTTDVTQEAQQMTGIRGIMAQPLGDMGIEEPGQGLVPPIAIQAEIKVDAFDRAGAQAGQEEFIAMEHADVAATFGELHARKHVEITARTASTRLGIAVATRLERAGKNLLHVLANVRRVLPTPWVNVQVLKDGTPWIPACCETR